MHEVERLIVRRIAIKMKQWQWADHPCSIADLPEEKALVRNGLEFQGKHLYSRIGHVAGAEHPC